MGGIIAGVRAKFLGMTDKIRPQGGPILVQQDRSSSLLELFLPRGKFFEGGCLGDEKSAYKLDVSYLIKRGKLTEEKKNEINEKLENLKKTLKESALQKNPEWKSNPYMGKETVANITKHLELRDERVLTKPEGRSVFNKFLPILRDVVAEQVDLPELSAQSPEKRKEILNRLFEETLTRMVERYGASSNGDFTADYAKREIKAFFYDLFSTSLLGDIEMEGSLLQGSVGARLFLLNKLPVRIRRDCKDLPYSCTEYIRAVVGELFMKPTLAEVRFTHEVESDIAKKAFEELKSNEDCKDIDLHYDEDVIQGQRESLDKNIMRFEELIDRFYSHSKNSSGTKTPEGNETLTTSFEGEEDDDSEVLNDPNYGTPIKGMHKSKEKEEEEKEIDISLDLAETQRESLSEEKDNNKNINKKEEKVQDKNNSNLTSQEKMRQKMRLD